MAGKISIYKLFEASGTDSDHKFRPLQGMTPIINDDIIELVSSAVIRYGGTQPISCIGH